MKYFYCFIAFVVVLFAGCGRGAGVVEYLYLCNELEEKVRSFFDIAIAKDSKKK